MRGNKISMWLLNLFKVIWKNCHTDKFYFSILLIHEPESSLHEVAGIRLNGWKSVSGKGKVSVSCVARLAVRPTSPFPSAKAGRTWRLSCYLQLHTRSRIYITSPQNPMDHVFSKCITSYCIVVFAQFWKVCRINISAFRKGICSRQITIMVNVSHFSCCIAQFEDSALYAFMNVLRHGD
jgi:hypothetical protein